MQALVLEREHYMARSKHELALEVEHATGIKPNLVKHVLDALAEIAAEDIAAGEDFVLPGIVRIKHTYVSPLKKGEKYKKGETYVGFGGVENVAEEDSKPRLEKCDVKPYLMPALKRVKPAKGSKGYKAVVARLKK